MCQSLTIYVSTQLISSLIARSWQQLPTFNFDLCTVTTCPIPAGPAKIDQQIAVPSISPSVRCALNERACFGFSLKLFYVRRDSIKVN